MADALGLRFFRAIATAGDGDEMRNDLRNGSYPGVDSDCALVLWLCSHDRAEIGWAADPFLRHRALSEVDKWADDHEVFPSGKDYGDNSEAALKILFSVFNALEQGDDNGGEKKNRSQDSSHTGQDTEAQ